MAYQWTRQHNPSVLKIAGHWCDPKFERHGGKSDVDAESISPMRSASRHEKFHIVPHVP